MKKWYKEPYFNRRNWILENFEKINITNDELVLLLLVDFAKESKKVISYEYLNKKLHKDNKEIDKIIASLLEKQYLKITNNAKGINFDIDGLFEFDPNSYEINENRDIYDLTAEVFARPLNSIELQKVSDLIDEFGEDKFNYGLKVAEAYNKLNMNYIEKIIRNDK